MGRFAISVTATGAHGCDRKAKPGERLHGRCSRLTCVDCLTYDFVQQLRQKGFSIEEAHLTHHPETPGQVCDDILRNVRESGEF